MKRFLCLFLVAILSFAMVIPCFAVENIDTDTYQYEYTYFEDGSYFVTEITDESTFVNARSTTTTKSKTGTYYNSSNVALWYVKVTGTFTYGSGTSSCTSSSVSSGSYSSSWKVTDTSASKSGATATAKGTGRHYLNGVVIESIPSTVNLTCDANGNFS